MEFVDYDEAMGALREQGLREVPDGDIEDPIGLDQSAYDALARKFLEIIPRRLKEMLDT